MHSYIKCILFSCLFILVLSQDKNVSITNIALVDFAPAETPSLTPPRLIQSNTETMVQIIKIINNETENIDVVVFPDKSLYYGLDVNQLANYSGMLRIGRSPCNDPDYDDYEKFIQDLSCSAFQFGTYIVANVISRENCLNLDHYNCRTYGYNLYSTNVIFDKEGILAGVDSPHYLIADYYFDRSEPTFYTTNLSATVDDTYYGTFFSNQYMAAYPTLQLTYARKIQHFFHTTQIIPELPFLTPIQIQQMFAQAYNISLFSAGLNSEITGSSGTGFYRGVDGPVQPKKIIKFQNSTINIYAYSPQDPSKNFLQPSLTTAGIDYIATAKDNLTYKIDPTVGDYQSLVLLPITQDSQEKICHEKLCCEFSLKMKINGSYDFQESPNYYTYHLVAWTGERNLTQNLREPIEVCGVIACLNSSLTSCGQRFETYDLVKWPITFEKIAIKSSSTDPIYNAWNVYYPNTLLSSITPISPRSTRWTVNEEGANFESTVSQNRLLTFAIYRINLDDYQYENNYDSGSESGNDNNSTTPISSTTVLPDGATTATFNTFLLLFISALYVYIV